MSENTFAVDVASMLSLSAAVGDVDIVVLRATARFLGDIDADEQSHIAGLLSRSMK